MDLEKRIVIRYALTGIWIPITTSFGKICPKDVVSGNSGLWFESFGTCSRTSRDSDNKIIRYVNTHRSWSVCQKPKQGILETNVYLNLLNTTSVVIEEKSIYLHL